MKYKKGDPIGYTDHHEYTNMSLQERLNCLRQSDSYHIFLHPSNSIFKEDYLEDGWYYSEYDGSATGPFKTQEKAEMAAGLLYLENS